MKIGFVLDDGLDVPDGVQQYVLTVGNWLADNGHEVHYLVGQTKTNPAGNVHSLSKNISVRFNKNKLTIPLPVSGKKMKNFLEDQKFDVLHVQMPYSPQFAGKVISSAPNKTAIVGTFHILPYGWLSRTGSWLLAKIENKSLSRFDAVVSVSDAAEEFARKTMGIESSILPNAVRLDRFRAGKPKAEFADKKNVVFLGRLVQRKGSMQLLKAVAVLQKSGLFEDKRCIIIGSGPLDRKLHKFVKDNHLAGYVLFTGQLDEHDKADYFATADLAVLPSLGGESFGIVVVEAIASGAKVTLGGDNPGYRFVLADTPLALINPNKTDEFADKINRLLSDQQLSSQLQSAQQQRIRQFDVNIIGPHLVDIYTQAISKHDKV